MRSWTARISATLSFLLLLVGRVPAQNGPKYLLIPRFETVAGSRPGAITLKGVVQNYCGTSLPAGTSLEISYNGRAYDIAVGGLNAGAQMNFSRAVQTGTALLARPGIRFRIVANRSRRQIAPDHYVSPCVPTLIKP